MAKVQNVEKWGRKTASERYQASGSDKPVTPALSEQAVQTPDAKHDASYDNDASGWVRGMGKQSPHPKFDKHKSGSK